MLLTKCNFLYINWCFQDESCLRTEDILKIIEEQGDSIALIMFSGNDQNTALAWFCSYLHLRAKVCRVNSV